jgi:hypothetical protein
MKRTTAALAFVLGLVPLAGCKDWAQAGVYTLTINAPARVARGGEFYFTLSAKDKEGQAVKVAYQWKVEWVGVEGTIHKGKAGDSEKIRVKGGVGTATLSIIGYDAQDNWGEIAKHSFEVE